MICPRCSVGEISEATQECLVCGFSRTGGVVVEANDWNQVDDPVLPALERQFQVEGMLRRGTASRIYLARDQVTGRLCSLKILPLADELPGQIERFRTDAQRAAALDHPHIVALHSFGATDEAVWYAMEYVQGRSLGDLLRTADRMDLKTCLRLVEQIASALEYGHRRGVTHGNLKPANVLVDPEGWARVADFGVGSAFGTVPRRQPELSIEENFGHVAPERFGSDGVVGPGSDQYALAVLTFACLARRPPFVGETLEAIQLHHLEGPVPLLAESRPDLPATVSAALARGMKRYPEERFAGVLDLVTALAGVTVTEPKLAVAVASTAKPVSGSKARAPAEEATETHPLLKLVEAEQASRGAEPEKKSAPKVEPAVVVGSAGAETAKPAEPAKAEETHHPPLLFVERGDGDRSSSDDLEAIDEDTVPEPATTAKAKGPSPVASDDDEEDEDTDDKSEPVLLWPAREGAPADADAAAALAEAAAGGEQVIFLDQARPKKRGPGIGARIWQVAGRWGALPRSTQIGSGAAAAVLVMALVWWQKAKGHEQPRRPDWVQGGGPAAGGESSGTRPTTSRQTPPRTSRPATGTTNPGTTTSQQRNPTPTNPTPDSGAGHKTVATASTEPAHLFINSTPWGVLYVDDKAVGNLPQADVKVSPGSHNIRVARDGYLPYETQIVIESGEVLRLTDIVLQEKPQ